jgi:uridine kinase
MLKKPFLVGITGGSASGKTRFIKQLVSAFSADQVCLLSQDNYYRERHLQPKDKLGIENFDLPESIDHQHFIDDVEALRRGETIFKKEYTFNNPNIEPKMLEFKPAPIILVEGLFVFCIEEIRKQFDLKLFIDAQEHIKLRRRIKRDNEERGYGLEDVLYRYEYHVAPTYEKFIKPFIYEADMIIPNNHAYDRALDVITSFLEQKIK